MIVPLTPIRFLYRGVDSIREKGGSGFGRQAIHVR